MNNNWPLRINVRTVRKGIRDPNNKTQREVCAVFSNLSNILNDMPTNNGSLLNGEQEKIPSWFLMGGLVVPAYTGVVYRQHDGVFIGVDIKHMGVFKNLIEKNGRDLCMQELMTKFSQHHLNENPNPDLIELQNPDIYEDLLKVRNHWFDVGKKEEGRRFYVYGKVGEDEVIRKYFGKGRLAKSENIFREFDKGNIKPVGLLKKLRAIGKKNFTKIPKFARNINVFPYSINSDGSYEMPGINLIDQPISMEPSKLYASDLIHEVEVFGSKIPVMSPESFAASKSGNLNSKDPYDIEILNLYGMMEGR